MAAAILGAFSVSVAAVGAAAVVLTVRSDSPLSAFVGGLFSEPVGYHNANAALFLVAFWPALMLASRREVPPLARGLFLATAGLLLPLVVLPQSRGSLIAFPLTLLVFLAIAPNRARCLLTLVPIVISTLLALGPLLDVYGPDGEREAARALEEARNISPPWSSRSSLSGWWRASSSGASRFRPRSPGSRDEFWEPPRSWAVSWASWSCSRRTPSAALRMRGRSSKPGTGRTPFVAFTSGSARTATTSGVSAEEPHDRRSTGSEEPISSLRTCATVGATKSRS